MIFISISFQCVRYCPTPSDILSILDRNNTEARRKHLQCGRLGQLLFDHRSNESVKLYRVGMKDEETDEKSMFDTQLNEWVNFDEDIVPWTYTMVPRPTSVALELDYFIRSAPLVKHKYIWARDNLTSEEFGKLRSHTNTSMLGRFITFVNMPDIRYPARMENGILVKNQNDTFSFM